MPLQTFTPPVAPSPGTGRTQQIKLLKAEFGDGYTQTALDGLNPIRRSLDLTWETLTPTQAKTITDFLNARGGTDPFWYTPSDETAPVKWTCEQWSDKNKKGGFRTITATFVQSFSLLT